MTRHTDFLQILTVLACAVGKDVLVGDDWQEHAKSAERRGWVTTARPNMDTTVGRRQLARSGEVWDTSGQHPMKVRVTKKGIRVYKHYVDFAKEARGIK